MVLAKIEEADKQLPRHSVAKEREVAQWHRAALPQAVLHAPRTRSSLSCDGSSQIAAASWRGCPSQVARREAQQEPASRAPHSATSRCGTGHVKTQRQAIDPVSVASTHRFSRTSKQNGELLAAALPTAGQDAIGKQVEALHNERRWRDLQQGALVTEVGAVWLC